MPLFGAAIESLKDHVAKHNAMVAGLKKRLFEGVVEFTYEKSDGTVRPARGTMKADLLPKTEPMLAFKCTDIVWDAPEGAKLPKRKTVYVAESAAEKLSTEQLEDAIGDKLSEAGKSFAREFRYERIEKDGPAKKMPEGTVFYYDLDKGEFRSFKTDRLVSVED